MTLPFHIGNCWFGGLLPMAAHSIVVITGDIYAGLWYPIIVSVVTIVIRVALIRKLGGRDLDA